MSSNSLTHTKIILFVYSPFKLLFLLVNFQIL
ncbi:hypothetical protein [Campylobacter phage CJLB-14]|nr:hypothetical protein [Campylobacter phage CJLB-14]